MQKNIDYDVLSSRIDFIFDNDKSQSFYCLNEPNDGFIYSYQSICFNNPVKKIIFYPFVDVCGFATVKNLKIDGVVLLSSYNETYLSKVDGYFNFECDLCSGNHLIEIKWKYRLDC